MPDTPHDENPPNLDPGFDQEYMDETMSGLEGGPAGPVKMSHPQGLWVLFITEMWERFSYYGMRALLVLYLIQSSSEQLASGAPNANPGFGWSEEAAAYLYAMYTWLVYLTPIIGGWLADKFLGTHRSMIVGGWIIASGHVVLACTEFFDITAGSAVTMQTSPGSLLCFLAGLSLIIIGTGFFKPCVSVMVGQLYGPDDPRRDSGFTIFYMGINLGAFMSPLVAGYLGEKVGWHWGFGSAAVGMVAGILTYQYLRPKFLKGVGLSRKQIEQERARGGVVESKVDDAELKRPLNFVDFQRILVILILAFVGNIFFWAAFEQAGSSMNVFAKNDTDRTLYGLYDGGWRDTQLDILYGDNGDVSDAAQATLQRVDLGWLDPATEYIYRDSGFVGLLEDPDGRFQRRDTSWFDTQTEQEYTDCGEGDAGEKTGFLGFVSFYFGSGGVSEEDDATAEEGALAQLQRIDGGWRDEVNERTFQDSGVISITDESERFERKSGNFPASYYQSVNALTIVLCAPLFSLLWVWLDKRRMNPSSPMKFCIGLWLLGLSFLAMVFGSLEAASDGQAGPHWLLITYIVYTWGELCLSPVGLSLVTKLAPAKLQSLMMGVWFFSFSLANLLGGLIAALSTRFKPEVGPNCVEIPPEIQIPGVEGLAGFYALLIAIPIAVGVLIMIISPFLKKMMHGVK